MATAGLYETSGDWLYDVGLPGKSGIGGGIVTVSPGQGRPRHLRPAARRGGQQRQGAARRALPLAPSSASTSSPRSRRRERALVVVAAAAALLLPSLASGAGPSDEQALAKRFAPVVELVAQAHECGNGESYEPIDVDALFGQPTVALRGPWGRATW